MVFSIALSESNDEMNALTHMQFSLTISATTRFSPEVTTKMVFPVFLPLRRTTFP